MKNLISFIIIASIPLIFACKQEKANVPTSGVTVDFVPLNPQTVSLLGNSLRSPNPSEELTKRWREKRQKYEEDPSNLDNIIWYGRFTAYMGNYIEAINIYSNGILQYPDEPRLYRHRGHRYITLRKFDKAISDLTKASTLIEGTENSVEPDGMPNARNIPVSTLHGNIYYHLGLAHYLQNNLKEALSAYQECLNTSSSNDNVVSAVHWLYCILMRMNRQNEAMEYLKNVSPEMDIIENHSYYKLCLFYKGMMSREEILNPEESASANDAVLYGVANWHLVNGERDEGINMLRRIVSQDSWPSFGYIAAEADLARKIN